MCKFNFRSYFNSVACMRAMEMVTACFADTIICYLFICQTKTSNLKPYIYFNSFLFGSVLLCHIVATIAYCVRTHFWFVAFNQYWFCTAQTGRFLVILCIGFQRHPPHISLHVPYTHTHNILVEYEHWCCICAKRSVRIPKRRLIGYYPRSVVLTNIVPRFNEIKRGI